MERFLAVVLAFMLLGMAGSAAAESTSIAKDITPSQPRASPAKMQYQPLAYQVENPGLASVSDENLLLAEVVIDNLLTEETIETYQHEGGILVPLGTLSKVLGLSITVDVESETARGWFLKENRIFALDVPKGEVVVEGKTATFNKAVVVPYQSDIYVDSTLFSSWFPVDVSFSFADLLLKVRPREPLPIQEKLARDAARSRMGHTPYVKKEFPMVPSNYQPYSVPALDADFGYDYSDSSDHHHQSSYSILSQGDVGYMNLKTFLSGDSTEALNSARVTAGRKDYKGEMLGKLGATEIEVGDIDSADFALATSRGRGRGVYVSNQSLDRPDQFDTTNFNGEAIPGWEVELYRNGVLQDFQIVGSDGRYDFNDVEIFYGNNNFRLVFYGPQGQVREETKNYNIGSSLLKEGEFSYRFSADEKSKSVLGVDEKDTTISHPDDMRMAGGVEYGINDQFSTTLGYVTTPLDDGRAHHYTSAGIRGSVGNVLTSTDVAYDTDDNAYATKFLAHTNYKDVSIRAEQSFFVNDFASEEEAPSTDPKRNESSLDLDGNIRGMKLLPAGLGYRFSAGREGYDSGRTVNSFGNRLSTSLFGTSFTNNLDWQQNSSEGADDITTTGDFSVRGKYNDITLRSSVDYGIQPGYKLQSVNLSAQKRLKSDVNLRGDVRKDLTGEGFTTFSSVLSKEFDQTRLSGSFEVNDDSDFAAGVTLSFSLNREPRNGEWFMQSRSTASRGAVSALAFLDKNYNGVFDEDVDEELPEVGFKAIGAGKSRLKKLGFLTDLEPDMPNDVVVDIATLEDPYMRPNPAGRTVVPHAGTTTLIDFPVVATTEVDGTLYIQKGESSYPLTYVTVEMVDKDFNVVNTTRSEYDGFFLFDSVIPGDYTLRVAEADLKPFEVLHTPDTPVAVPDTEDVISGMDITVVVATPVERDAVDALIGKPAVEGKEYPIKPEDEEWLRNMGEE